MNIEKIKKTNYSNSGKTKYIRIYITDESNFKLELSNNQESCNNPEFGKRVFKEKLTPSSEEIEKYLSEKNKHFEEKVNAAIQQEIERKNKEIEFQSFLDSLFVEDIYFSQIYDDVLKRLHSNGDYTKYSYIEIVLVCLAYANMIKIKWFSKNGYNSHPKLVNDILANESKDLNTINGLMHGGNLDIDSPDVFYILRDNKAIYKIECENEIIDKYFYDIDYTDFEFKITKI